VKVAAQPIDNAVKRTGRISSMPSLESRGVSLVTPSILGDQRDLTLAASLTNVSNGAGRFPPRCGEAARERLRILYSIRGGNL
jgi:hypothetical protein